MADTSALEKALVNADAAGDVDAAKALAGEITRVRSAEDLSALVTGKATSSQKALASPLSRLFRGAILDPVDAGAQLLPHALEKVTSLGGLYDNPVSDFFKGEADRVDSINRDREQRFESARTATGQSGIDGYRLAGNVISPANKVIAGLAPMKAATTVGRATQGAITGGVGAAALSPVNVGEDESYWGNKAVQTGMGAVTGGVLAPVLGKVMDAAAVKLAAYKANPEVLAARASMETDEILGKALQESGQSIKDLNPAYVQSLRAKIIDSFKSGQKLDAAALLRKDDFDQLGLPYLKGQITRDPKQFAFERNMRAAPEGSDILARFDHQNKSLQDMATGWTDGLQSPYQTGNRVIGELSAHDAQLKAGVDQAYGAARDHLGRAAPMDSAAFSQQANHALDDGMLGHYLPAEVRSILNDVTAGKIPFNVNTAVQIDSTLSAAQRSAGQGSPQALAIGKVRDALNSAGIADNVGVDAKAAFDSARGLARQRFSAHEQSPALGAVAEGSAIPDNFVKKYVMNGTVDDLSRTVKLLSPDAIKEVRAQIGLQLQKAAFGQNKAGDKLLAPERFASGVEKIPPEKLRLFFSPQEIDQINRMTRVGAYINSTPSAAPVMGNPNMFWASQLLGSIPGVSPLAQGLIGAGKAISQGASRQKAIADALKAEIPQKASELSPQQKAMIAKLLTAGTAGIGAIGASPLR